MSIKFNCSHCHKSLKVSQALAGKKARCPGCKQVITIPTLESLSPAPADLTEIEDVAAAALAEESKPQPVAAPQQTAAPIKFTCFYCAGRIQVASEVAGKHTARTQARRIAAVP